MVKADRPPQYVDKPCSNGNLHSFQELGEVGNTLYVCKYCRLGIETNGKPKSTNDCHEKGFHDWIPFDGGKYLKNIKFDSKDSMKHKNVVHRAHLRFLNIVKVGAFGIGILIFGGIFLKNLLVGGFLLLKDFVVEQFSINPTPCIIIISVIVILIVFGIIYKIKRKV
jgi:hypothetical protein